jgi:tRNA A-37 threonylcarbamoyl transferase component Bud32
MLELIGKSVGRYQIKSEIGRGGMANVYLAFDQTLKRDVALKVIRRTAFSVELWDHLLKRFEREAIALAGLDDDHIVRLFDYGEYEGSPYLVMQYVPGGTLRERLGRVYPYREAAEMLLPLARALEYAHENGIIHRDVKPANILITRRGQPTLSDFGIAKILETDQGGTLTGTGVGVGTAEYMAPEQASGKAIPQSDIYSLGVVFYEMITGKKPYIADTPMAVLIKHLTEPLPSPRLYVPDLPAAVLEIVTRSMAKNVEDRYSQMTEMVTALEGLLGAERVAPAAAAPAEPAAATPQTSPSEVARAQFSTVVAPAKADPVSAEPPPVAAQVDETPPAPADIATQVDETPDAPADFATQVEDGPRLPVDGVTQVEEVPYSAGAVTQVSAGPRAAAEDVVTQVDLGGAAAAQTASAGQKATARNVSAQRPKTWLWGLVGVVAAALLLFGASKLLPGSSSGAQSSTPAAAPAGGSGAANQAFDFYFTSSRDGKREIYRLSAAGESIRVTNTPGFLESFSPALSATGDVYFSRPFDGGTELFRLETNGSVVQVTHASGSVSDQATPVRGGTIYFISNRGGRFEIYRLEVAGGDPVKVTDSTGTNGCIDPFLGPNGEVFFSSDRTGHFEIYRLDTNGVTVQVTWTNGGGSWAPVVTAGGDVYFTSDRDGHREIYRLNAAGGDPVRVTTTVGGGGSYAVLPDLYGNLYFTSDRTGKREIFRLDATGNGTAVQVTHTEKGESWTR